MKKIIMLVVVLVTALSSSMVVFADSQDVNFTVEVPETKYTLQIPASQELTYGEEFSYIGDIAVSESEGFFLGKKLALTISYDSLKNSENDSAEISYELALGSDTETPNESIASLATNNDDGSYTYYFNPNDEGVVDGVMMQGSDTELPHTFIVIGRNIWKEAVSGNYTTVINFTSEIVCE